VEPGFIASVLSIPRHFDRACLRAERSANRRIVPRRAFIAKCSMPAENTSHIPHEVMGHFMGQIIVVHLVQPSQVWRLPQDSGGQAGRQGQE
jgi:hypothetical protein